MDQMMPAKSCFSCFYGGTGKSPECSTAATELCCEEWAAPKDIRIRAAVDFEIDLKEIAMQYGGHPPKVTPDNLDAWFQDLFRSSLPDFLFKRLKIDDEHRAIEITDVSDYEICYGSEEEFQVATAAQKAVIVA